MWQLSSVTPGRIGLKASRGKKGEEDEVILIMVQKQYLGKGEEHKIWSLDTQI